MGVFMDKKNEWDELIENLSEKKKTDEKHNDNRSSSNSNNFNQSPNNQSSDNSFSVTKLGYIIGGIGLGILVLGLVIDPYEIFFSWSIPSIILIAVGLFILKLAYGPATDDGDSLSKTTTSSYKAETQEQKEARYRSEYLLYVAEWKMTREAYDRGDKHIKQPTSTPASYEMWKISKGKR